MRHQPRREVLRSRLQAVGGRCSEHERLQIFLFRGAAAARAGIDGDGLRGVSLFLGAPVEPRHVGPHARLGEFIAEQRPSQLLSQRPQAASHEYRHAGLRRGPALLRFAKARHIPLAQLAPEVVSAAPERLLVRLLVTGRCEVLDEKGVLVRARGVIEQVEVAQTLVELALVQPAHFLELFRDLLEGFCAVVRGQVRNDRLQGGAVCHGLFGLVASKPADQIAPSPENRRCALDLAGAIVAKKHAWR